MTTHRSSGPVEPYPSALIGWYGLLTFVVANVINGMDRTIVSYLVEPLKHDLRISDVQVSLLSGLAFTMFYAVVSLPLGFVTDLVSRKRLLMAGILTWSVATVACGLATSFPAMFAARLVVGLGEATLTPCVISMLADLFPSDKRSRPLSIFFLGNSISGGIAITVTGAIVGLPHEVFAPFPFLRDLAQWRIAFLFCGALGVLNTAMLAFLPDLKRRGALLSERTGLGVKLATGYFVRHWQVFTPFYLANAFYSFATLSVFTWSVPFIMRHFHVSLPYIGARQGVVNIVMAMIGSASSAFFLSAVVKRGGVTAKMKLAPWLPVMIAPYVLLGLAPTPWVAFLLVGYSPMLAPLMGATLLGTLAELVPAEMRGIAVAIFSFMSTMLGASLGPLAVAAVTEHVLHDPSKVGWSIMIVGAPALALSCTLFLLSKRGLRRMRHAGGEIAGVIAANEGRNPVAG